MEKVTTKLQAADSDEKQLSITTRELSEELIRGAAVIEKLQANSDARGVPPFAPHFVAPHLTPHSAASPGPALRRAQRAVG